MATKKITVLDEGAPLLGAGLPPIRTKVGAPSPGGARASRRAHGAATNGTTRSTMGAFAAAVLLVTGAGGAAYRYRTHQLQAGEISVVAQRTLAKLQEKPQWCNSCAVVIPTDTYSGKGWGQQIDAADCVVRFNDRTPSTVSPEDLGMKDSIRFISGDGPGNPAWSSPCAVADGCEREFVTYDVSSDPNAMKAIADAPEIELTSVLAGLLNTGDPHVALRNYATTNAYPSVPTWASAGFVAVNALKHPRMCGSLAIYGVGASRSLHRADAEDTTGTHDYPLEHHLMREAVEAKAPGWETVRVVDMDATANDVWSAEDDANLLAFSRVTTMYTPPTHLVPTSAEPKGLDKLKVDPVVAGDDGVRSGDVKSVGPDPNPGSGAAGVQRKSGDAPVAGLAMMKNARKNARAAASADTRGASSSPSSSPSSSSSSSETTTFAQPWTNNVEADDGTAGAFAKPWSAGSEPDWSKYNAMNHAAAVEHERDWGDVLGAWDEANEAHRAAYVPKKVYRHRGAPTTMAQAGRGIALPGE